MEKIKTKKKPNSIFRKLEIDSISDIFTIYLHKEINQEIINNIALECANFLYLKKDVDVDMINKAFKFGFNFVDKDHILVVGHNLLSSLWIIGIYPKKPENLIGKKVYNDGDFTYKFYTKNQNLSITKNKKDEGKFRSNQRNRKVSKRTQ